MITLIEEKDTDNGAGIEIRIEVVGVYRCIHTGSLS